MLTVKEVADKLNVCQITILRHLNNGTIAGVKYGNRWRIAEDEVDRVIKEGM